jgi:hypothetical protein
LENYGEVEEEELVVVGIMLVLLAVGLSGCTDDRNTDTDGDGYPDEIDHFPDDSSEWLDCDSDGYGDNGDDFPNDDNFHEKYNMGYGTYTLEGTQGRSAGDYISSDWKRVYFEWELTSPSYLTDEQKDNIFLHVKNPGLDYSEGKYYFYGTGTLSRSVTIYIDATNWGQWEYSFSNLNGLENPEITITIEYEIYRIR